MTGLKVTNCMEKRDVAAELMKSCRICPRECGANRTAGEYGFCGAGAQMIVARAALHHWEEPCISGHAGSGAVFFSGCNLGCIFCQNAEISGIGRSSFLSSQSVEQAQAEHKVSSEQPDKGEQPERRMHPEKRMLPGIAVSTQRLSQIFLNLQNEEHANNINLVTATHYIPQVAEALAIAKEQGLRIPVIYNSGGYEKVSSLRMLDGLIDVYLPDFKYMHPETAKQYSHAADYPDRAKEAIAEMVRQTGAPVFYQEGQFPDAQEAEAQPAQAREAEAQKSAAQTRTARAAESQTKTTRATEAQTETVQETEVQTEAAQRDGIRLMKRGVIVRHLLLPGHVSEAKEIVAYLHETYRNRIILSLMNQYTPMPHMSNDPLLGRKTTKREYDRLIDHALEIGVEYGFIQEGETAKESFIPAWNGEGVRQEAR